MIDDDPIGGLFWTPENPATQSRGTISRIGEDYQAELEANLLPDPRVHPFPGGGGFSFSAVAADSVKSFAPITVHGLLDDGTKITMLEAHKHGGVSLHWGPGPQYRAHVVIVGDEVSGLDQKYSAVKFRLGHPYWLGHLVEGTAAAIEDDQSTISVQTAPDGNWLVYESSRPATLRQLEIRVVSGCIALMSLALYLDDEPGAVDTQVRIDSASPWLDVLGSAFSSGSNEYHHTTLLAREELTLERFAKWIVLNDKFDGLAHVVARRQTGALQGTVLIYTTLVEGLHRRLPYQNKRFPSLSKKATERIGSAARQGARWQAAIEGADPAEANPAVAFFDERGYFERASEIIEYVAAAVPEVSEGIEDLPRRMTKARNSMAHHLVEPQRNEPLSARVLEWLIIEASIRWILRCLLLLHAGVEPVVLRERVTDFQRFQFYRANLAEHITELEDARNHLGE